jgi:MFS family permease
VFILTSKNRKIYFLISSILGIISSVGCSLSFWYPMLILFNTIYGFLIGLLSLLSPMYVSENSPPEIRGRLGVLFQFGATLGFINTYVVAFIGSDLNENEFRLQYGFILIFSLILLVFYFITPETKPEKIPDFTPYKDQIKSLIFNKENLKLLFVGIVLVCNMRLTGNFYNLILLG